MSVPDRDRKDRVYQYVKDLCNLNELQYAWTVDWGDRETAIIFDRETGQYRFPNRLETQEGIRYPEMWEVPDLCVKRADPPLVIEIEEETGPRKTGARMADKGHGHDGDLPGKNDAEKYENYDAAGIRYCRVWETELNTGNVWKMKLNRFILDCANEERLPKTLKELPDLETNSK
jgi:hypothetical protein